MATTINFPTSPSVDQEYTYMSTTYVWDGTRWYPKYTDNTVYSESYALSDETTDLTTGTNKLTFRIPYDWRIEDMKINVNTAPTGSAIIVDLNRTGTGTMMITNKLVIDATEETSRTASVPFTITDDQSDFYEDVEMTVDIDQVGSTIAGAGLKLTIYYTRGTFPFAPL